MGGWGDGGMGGWGDGGMGGWGDGGMGAVPLFWHRKAPRKAFFTHEIRGTCDQAWAIASELPKGKKS